MKTKILLPVILIIVVAAYMLLRDRGPKEATMVLHNGIVHTVNEKQPLAQAIAIRGGYIVAVGSDEEIRKEFVADEIIDLQGRPVYPGFIDSHAHIENLGAILMNLDLSMTRSVAEIQNLLAERMKTISPGVWIRGRGWDQMKWSDKSFPAHHMLDVVAKDIPVYFERVDGHAVWVNKTVLDLAGINSATPDPEGGRIVRDAAGNPTGVFIDNAIDLLDVAIPPPSREERTQAIERAIQKCIKFGITQVHDMQVDLATLEIYKHLIETNRFPLRVYAALDGLKGEWKDYLERGPEIGSYDGKLTVRALKMFVDGALGSRGAALIEPYADEPTNRGLTLTSTSDLAVAAKACLDKGFQLCLHAIGDRANHIALNVYEEAFRTAGAKSEKARFRIEHVQVLDERDISRFRSLGVLPSMQPAHCTSDMYWAEERLGPKRVLGAYAWRSLISTGSIVAAGSDFPVESPNPLWGFHAAITREDHSGWPGGGWYPKQKMTRQEALKSFTTWGAYAAFEEDVKGTIEPGKLADLVVLAGDIMSIAPEQILTTTVDLTILDGKVVYSSGTLISGEITSKSPGLQ